MMNRLDNQLLLLVLVPLLGLTLLASAGEAQEPRKLLILTHAGLYKHASLAPAEQAVTELGAEGGFEVTTVQGYLQDPEDFDFSFFTPEYLAQFDGLMMMTNGNLPMTDAQKASIVDFVRRGGAFVGFHNASLTFYDYPEFGEMLGGYFRRAVQQGKVFVLKVEDQDHPATRMLGPSWPIVDEFYQFGTAAWDPARPEENVDVLFGNRIPVGFSRARVNVLLSIDTELTDMEGLTEMSRGGDYPMAWSRTFGEGRSFYSAIGHRDDIWSNDPVFRAHVLGGIRWALGLEN
ncbi:MAG: ThuA domain-containing protein [Gemmatimonadota bacterium]